MWSGISPRCVALSREPPCPARSALGCPCVSHSAPHDPTTPPKATARSRSGSAW
jgi:hypothetical protein